MPTSEASAACPECVAIFGIKDLGCAGIFLARVRSGHYAFLNSGDPLAKLYGGIVLIDVVEHLCQWG